MSTRVTKLIVGPVHIFRDVASPGIYIDLGRDPYNRAWKIWPLTLRRLY